MNTVSIKQHLKILLFKDFNSFFSGTVTQQYMSKKNGPYLKHKSTTILNAIS